MESGSARQRRANSMLRSKLLSSYKHRVDITRGREEMDAFTEPESCFKHRNISIPFTAYDASCPC